MASKIAHFQKAQRKARLRSLLAQSHWSLDTYDDVPLEGPVLYFLDVESGYQQVAQLASPLDTHLRLKPKVFDGLIAAITLLTRHLVLQTPLPKGFYVGDPKRQLLEWLAQYSSQTRTFQICLDKGLRQFSMYVMHYFDISKDDYLLRPFATHHTELQSPDAIEARFTEVLMLDYQAHPERFMHKAPILPFKGRHSS